MTFRAWRAILARAFWAMGTKNLSVAAAGVAFFAFLSLFPALGVIAALLGLVVDPPELQNYLWQLRDLLPLQTRTALQEHIDRLLSTPEELAGTALVLSVVLGLWSTNASIRGMMMALNIAYREDERRSIIRFHVIAMMMTVAGILFVLLIFATLAVLPVMFDVFGLSEWLEKGLRFLRWPLLAVLSGIGLAVLYAVGPSRREAKWRWVSWGATIATLVWLGAAALYSFYLGEFADYQGAFGSLGAVVGLLMWFYISAYCTLFGAVLNAEMELQTARDTTVGPPRPMGDRGAYVADHVVD